MKKHPTKFRNRSPRWSNITKRRKKHLHMVKQSSLII